MQIGGLFRDFQFLARCADCCIDRGVQAAGIEPARASGYTRCLLFEDDRLMDRWRSDALSRSRIASTRRSTANAGSSSRTSATIASAASRPRKNSTTFPVCDDAVRRVSFRRVADESETPAEPKGITYEKTGPYSRDGHVGTETVERGLTVGDGPRLGRSRPTMPRLPGGLRRPAAEHTLGTKSRS
jgi:hypothetical protein